MALDAGVNLIDTADVYSGGASEEILGEALGGRRDAVLLATKARFADGRRARTTPACRATTSSQACEASLRRLQTDYIDLYQVHEWDGQTPLEETLAALDHLLDSGKVRYVGCSNFTGWQLMKALGVADRARPARGSSASRSTTRCRSARPSTRSCPSAIDQGLGCWSGARSPAACCRASTAAASRRRRARATLERLGRAAGLRRGQALRHDRRRWSRSPRRTASRRRRSRWPGCSTRPGVTSRDRRRAHRRAARRQPRRGRRSSSPPRSWPGSTR